jgi:MOSC domain-containing protein YiiM
MVAYGPGELEEAKHTLDELGFQHQSGADPFPEDRPMRIGGLEFEGSRFRIHVHVIAQDSPEVEELIGFRDRLRSDPDLLDRYVARKREIIGEGKSNPDEYALAKGKFVEGELGRTTWKGVVERLYIGAEATKPMVERWEVRALDGKGLEGDRYAEGRGTFSKKAGTGRHVTLIESEAIAAVAKDKDISADLTRRNIVTRGVPLNHLVGSQFRVGEVVLKGMRLCEPCGHLSRLLDDDEVRSAFLHRGGLRAEVIRGGRIRAKDAIVPVSEP